MHGQEGGVDTDDAFARKVLENSGAFILGRNMFGPVRGPWLDDSWKGWWGDNPPYHAPTFVLTHYERESLVMEGGTTFYFVTGGIEEALRLAKQAAVTAGALRGLIHSCQLDASSMTALGCSQHLRTAVFWTTGQFRVKRQ